VPSDPLTSVGDEIAPGSGVIEVHVNELNQLFNSMDPSPFLERDLDVDAEEFIVSWARELPAHAPLALRVHLDRATVVPHEGRMVGDAVHTYFRHRSELTQHRLRDLLGRGRTSLVIGLVFLTGSILVGRWINALLHDRPLGEILSQSLIIGGWVAMWRPMEIFLYDWWPIRRERRIFDRLGTSAVRIVCSGKVEPDHSRVEVTAGVVPAPR
jgi:hypothetical protein